MMKEHDKRRLPARAEGEPDLFFMLNCYDVWSLRPADRTCPEPVPEPGAG